MSLPLVGESLDPGSTLEAQARRVKRMDSDVCVSCKTSPYPRGFNRTSGLCWWCEFPRSKK